MEAAAFTLSLVALMFSVPALVLNLWQLADRRVRVRLEFGYQSDPTVPDDAGVTIQPPTHALLRIRNPGRAVGVSGLSLREVHPSGGGLQYHVARFELGDFMNKALAGHSSFPLERPSVIDSESVSLWVFTSHTFESFDPPRELVAVLTLVNGREVVSNSLTFPAPRWPGIDDPGGEPGLRGDVGV